jgi:hypothetical protein
MTYRDPGGRGAVLDTPTAPVFHLPAIGLTPCA